MQKRNIPDQIKGSKTDNSYSVDFDSPEEAKQHYQVCKTRLLNVSDWHSLTGTGTAEFELTDANGTPVRRVAEPGDFFKIDIPAPGSVAGGGNDWVQIEAIDSKGDSTRDEEYIAIKVRPAGNPRNKDKETAHFFKEDATSTFLVSRSENTVSAEIHGRNEVPNTEETNVIDTLRNAVVAVGAMLGFSDAQWKRLAKGLVEKS